MGPSLVSAAVAPCFLDVAPHHAARIAAPLHLSQIDRILLGRLSRRRRCARLRACTLCVSSCTLCGSTCTLRVSSCTLSIRSCTLCGSACTLSIRSCTLCGSTCTLNASTSTLSASACTLLDRPQYIADFHIRAVLVIDPGEHAGARRRDLEIDLVGFELDERITGGDRVPFFLEPLGDTGVDDGFSDFRNDNVY